MEKIPTITINNGVSCPECGKPGATIGNDGTPSRCLGCAARKITLKIGPRVTGKMLNMVDALFERYQKDMDMAYQKTGELQLTFSLKLSPTDQGDIYIEIPFSFVKDKVKDKEIGTANENQQTLFKEE